MLSVNVNNGERGDEQDVEEAEEECWDLPSNFDLYAKHEIKQVYYPGKPNDGGDDRRSFRIECIEPDTPLDINNQSQSSQTYDATGHCVWTGAFLLIRCIRDLAPYIGGSKRAIEFGCGTGIGGLALMLVDDASIVPAEMCFTDNDPDALKVCERNCKLNGLSETAYSLRELTWGEEAGQTEAFDVALATDVLYDVDLIDPLFTTIASCLPRGGCFILSHIPRACYNEGNPPEAVADLEKYIIDQASKYNLRLMEILRPPEEKDLTQEMVDWCPAMSFAGGGVLLFRMS